MPTQTESPKPSPSFNDRPLLLFLLVFIVGLVLLAVAHWLHDEHSAWKLAFSAVIRELGALVIVGGALHQIWEHYLKRSFALEILSMARAGADLATAGVKSFSRAEGFNLHISWPPLISKSRTMQVLVAYGRSWRNSIEQDLKKFASKGGHLTLFLPNYQNACLMSALADQFGKTPSNVATEITDAIHDFQGYFAGTPNMLTIMLLDKQPHLTVYRFDHEVVVALPKYSSGRGEIFVIEATNDGTFGKFIENELNELAKVGPFSPIPQSTSLRPGTAQPGTAQSVISQGTAVSRSSAEGT